MIRLLLLLCAGLFLTLQIGGQDRGQTRFGLLEAQKTPVFTGANTDVQPPKPAVADDQGNVLVLDGTASVSAAGQIAPVVFVPAQPLIPPVAQTETPVRPATSNDPIVKYVTGRSVNVRSGPSTRDAVMGRLTRGEAVSVMSVDDGGWARVLIEGDGIDGYMSTSFLADAP
ncbi:MAG: SH3 domain-containing protein [Paracoccaceae bacterium]